MQAALVHRVFLAPIKPGLDAVSAHRHWTERHAGVFAKTPRLAGYTQNRPLPEAWPARTHLCAEAWFASREDEAAGWGSDYYRTEVTQDEWRFVDRPNAWVSRINPLARATATRRYRVLAFGHTPVTAAAVSTPVADWDPAGLDVFELATPPPSRGPRSLLGLWTDDLVLARRVAADLGPQALLARPVPVVPAPEPPWTAAVYEENR